jgi:hypothetical protein
MNDHVQRLLIATGFSFLMPGAGYLIGLLWSSGISRVFGVPPSPKYRRLWSVFCLASPIFLLGSTVGMGFEDLHVWWIESPYMASGFFLLLFALIPLLLVVVIIRVWHQANGDASKKSF